MKSSEFESIKKILKASNVGIFKVSGSNFPECNCSMVVFENGPFFGFLMHHKSIMPLMHLVKVDCPNGILTPNRHFMLHFIDGTVLKASDYRKGKVGSMFNCSSMVLLDKYCRKYVENLNAMQKCMGGLLEFTNSSNGGGKWIEVSNDSNRNPSNSTNGKGTKRKTEEGNEKKYKRTKILADSAYTTP